jgi:hypothetical protein
MNVHFWEEPIFAVVETPQLKISRSESGVRVLTPVLPSDLSAPVALTAQRSLLDAYITDHIRTPFFTWYNTPLALAFSNHLFPKLCIYDCMDELSAFHGAPAELLDRERQLFGRADVVFTGGASLYEAKRKKHRNVHLFPSSVDKEHFATARTDRMDPVVQQQIPHPRIGFFGVIDERLDTNLIREVASAHPEWQFVLIGPVVKISEDELPRAENIHYLGKKEYPELPEYLANWDVAMLPFARNESTRFISPTKTPEYLAAGKRVVSTAIQDVVTPYGDLGLVAIAQDPSEFGAAIAECIMPSQQTDWGMRVDQFLAEMSWDRTVDEMWQEIQHCAALKLDKQAGFPIAPEVSAPYV